jgi:hypothetical protein
MRYSVILPSLLFTAILFPHPAFALSPVEVNTVARQVTVKIFGGGTLGTGTIVSKKGDRYTVLTTGHVVKANTTYKAIAPDGRIYTITGKTDSSTGIDLAAVSFTSRRKYAVANIGDSANLHIGEQIHTVGFPGVKPEYTFGDGEIEANSDSNFRQGYSLMYQCQKIAPGMSGGGVFNIRGELIGVTGMSIGYDGEGIREGLAAGIGSRRFVKWAEAAHIPLRKHLPDLAPTSVTADDLLVTAMDKSDRRDLQEAIVNYDRAIDLKPDYSLAYYRRGLSKEQLGDRAGANIDYSRAIDLKPSFTDAYLSRGLNQGILGNWQKAIDDYNLGIALRPTDPFAHSIRGLYKSLVGDLNGSISDYDRSIALQPRYADTYRSRAAVKEKLNDPQGAISDYDRAISLKPDFAIAYDRRATLKDELQDRQGAMTDYTTAAKLYRDLGDTNASKQSIDRLNRIAIDNKGGS